VAAVFCHINFRDYRACRKVYASFIKRMIFIKHVYHKSSKLVCFPSPLRGCENSLLHDNEYSFTIRVVYNHFLRLCALSEKKKQRPGKNTMRIDQVSKHEETSFLLDAEVSYGCALIHSLCCLPCKNHATSPLKPGLRFHLEQGLQTFLSEGHISYYGVRELDTLHNVIVPG